MVKNIINLTTNYYIVNELVKLFKILIHCTQITYI